MFQVWGKTYLWIVCNGIYESQGGLGEESTWTVCNHRGCSPDQGLMREVFHLLQTEDQYFNSPQTKYEEQEQTFFLRNCCSLCCTVSGRRPTNLCKRDSTKPTGNIKRCHAHGHSISPSAQHLDSSLPAVEKDTLSTAVEKEGKNISRLF